tara:strand:- start:375 stop:1151 length:777 start_codon:yes stop_codon:yes gene_type:complete
MGKLKVNKKEFKFGESKPLFKELLVKELVNKNSYECKYPVRQGDVVLDLGASIGPFTYSIMDKASKVYAVEPLIELHKTLKENTVDQGFPVEIIDKVLHYDNIPVIFNNSCVLDNLNNRTCQGITFKSLIDEYNIEHIDFLKFDIEGGEYCLFRDENMDFLKNNVRNLVGEFHLYHKHHQVEFIYFKDKFLKQFPHFSVYSWNGVDIGWILQNWENRLSGIDNNGNIVDGKDFFNLYSEIIIHISNEKEGSGPGYGNL